MLFPPKVRLETIRTIMDCARGGKNISITRRKFMRRMSAPVMAAIMASVRLRAEADEEKQYADAFRIMGWVL